MVLIGGARRVEAEASIREAFGLDSVVWMSIEENPTPAQLERVIRRAEVSVVLLLVRWARHAYTDAKRRADRHGKSFIWVEGGYNPNGLANDILEQASERLEGHASGRLKLDHPAAAPRGAAEADGRAPGRPARRPARSGGGRGQHRLGDRVLGRS